MTVTQNGLAAASQLLPTDLTTLQGTVTTAASTGPFTTTVDLRDYLKVGDLIIFSGQADVVYGISAITSTSVSVAVSYAGTTGAGQTMVKASFNTPLAGGTGTAVSSPTQSAGAGTAGATNGSTAVTGSSTAYNTLFAAGDSIIFTGDNPTVAYVIRSITSATALVIETNYTGTTATGKAYQKANFSPRRHDATQASSTTSDGQNGRFGSVAIGTTITASGATDTGLGAEITTNGGQRRTGTNVTTFLTSGDSGVTWKSNWQTTWTFTGGFSVAEVGIFNDATANQGVCLTRQAFAATLVVVATDLLNLQISVQKTGAATATGASVSIGLKEACKLLMDPGTTKGTDNPTTPGSTWTSVQGTQFDTIALGTGSTAPALADTALGTELSTNGCTRITGASTLGTIMRDPDASNVTPFTFTTDGSTTLVGDTVQWRAVFSITGTQAVREQGVFNGSVSGNNDPASGSRMLIRQVFAADLSLVNTDTYLPLIRLQST